MLLSDRAAADGSGLKPVTLAAGGLVVGAAAVTALGVAGVMPLGFMSHDTVVAGCATSFAVPVIALGVVSTAMAYTLGIMGIARLRPRFRVAGGADRDDVRRAVGLDTAGRAVVLAGLAWRSRAIAPRKPHWPPGRKTRPRAHRSSKQLAVARRSM
jgi:hypothetical protein